MKNLFRTLALLLIVSNTLLAQRQVEELNRGLIGLYKGGKTVYLGWRLLAREDWTVGFNVYRSVNGGAATKLNATPITNSTNYTDLTAVITNTNAYYVRTVADGTELETSETFTLAANTPNRQFFPIPLQATATEYDVLHVYTGDVDGDGDFDYIVKRNPVDAKNNYIILECYLNDGTFKWRINLGPNVDTYISSMTAPVLVADFNGDGKAEIIAKTGEETTFGDGMKLGDINKDGITDYNSHAGSGTYANVMTGPEYISLINGETGAQIDRNNFIARGVSTDWGDDYGARMNFIMSSVGSFDGVKPGVIFSRGPGKYMGVEAWEVTNNKLVRKWQWSARGKTFSPGNWEDFHQIQCIDVNGDGKDEISWGACMMNPDGTVRYTTEMVHGDRFQITDINPNRPGLEVFAIQQNNNSLLASAIYDASTGTMLKKWYTPALQDIGRGDVGDIDPNSPGMELFDLGSNNLHASDGSEAVTGSRPYPDVSIWWDADLLREQFRGIGGQGTNPAIEKWDYTNHTQGRIFTIYNDWGSYSVVSPYGGRAPYIGDIMGDWREEIILEASDHSALRVYTSKEETTFRIYTLMQNPSYRNATSSKGYLCSKYTDYFLGAGMTTPPKPNIKVVGTTNNAPNIALASPADKSIFTLPTSITLKAVASDRDGTVAKVEFFSGTVLIGTATAAPYTYSWANPAAGTYRITAKATDNSGASTTTSAADITVNGPKPIVYIYQCATTELWANTANWTPAALPTANDTAVVRSGEAKIAQDFGGVIKVEAAGTFRVTASVSAPDVRLQGGTLRSYTSTPLFTLTTVLTAEKASTVNVGSAGTSVFQIAGTLQGSGDLTKTGIGVLQLTAASANYKGMWHIKEGVLQVSSASGLGLCGAVAESSSTINVAAASATNTITLKTGAKIDLGADLTVQSAVFGSTNLAAGKYNAADFPEFITGTGSLIVAQNLMQPSSPNKGSITLTAGSGSSYSWYNGANLAGSSAAYTPAASGIYTLLATNQAGCTATSSPIYVQVIPLETGWNLISANLRPADSSIAVLFKGLDVQEIKSMDAFWQKNQQPMLNSLKTITIGNGYLVRMNTSGTLSISGIPVSDTQTFSQANPSWQIIGCPYQNQTPFSSIFNTSNCSVIKNFSGFWAPSGTTSSLSGFDPGKAYFMKK